MKRIKPEHAKLLQSQESSGETRAGTEPSATSMPDDTSESPKPSDIQSEATPAPSATETESPVMQRLHQKAREEAENGTGATKGPHPYEYQVSDSSAIPEAFRDANYDVSDALIQAHMQDCWNHNRQVIIKGLLIGQRV